MFWTIVRTADEEMHGVTDTSREKGCFESPQESEIQIPCLHLRSSRFRICFLVVLVWFCWCGWLVGVLGFLFYFVGVILFCLFILNYYYCFNAH